MAVVFNVWTGAYHVEPEPDRLEEVSEAYPEPAVKAAAVAALGAAVADLGLPSSTRIVWCTTESETSRTLRSRHGDDAPPWRTVAVSEPARGLVQPHDPASLWVVADQTPEAVANTIRHECRHSWQLQPGAYRWAAPELATMALRESDAAAYAASQPTPAATHTSPLSTAPRSTAPSRPSAASRTRHSPTLAEAAMAERRAGFFEHKGRQCSRCDICAEIVPLCTVHRCTVAARWRPR